MNEGGEVLNPDGLGPPWVKVTIIDPDPTVFEDRSFVATTAIEFRQGLAIQAVIHMLEGAAKGLQQELDMEKQFEEGEDQ